MWLKKRVRENRVMKGGATINGEGESEQGGKEQRVRGRGRRDWNGWVRNEREKISIKKRIKILAFVSVLFVRFWVCNVGKPWQNMTKIKSH